MLAVLGALAAPAAAQTAAGDLAPPGSFVPEAPPAPPVFTPRFHFYLGGQLRFTGLDGHAAAAHDQLMGDGWAGVTSPVMPGFSADAEYLLTPIVDLGVSWAWMAGDHATGVDSMHDRVGSRVDQLGVTARLHWAKGRPFVPEPRLDAGVASERVELHHVGDSRTITYVRIGADWRLGTRKAGVQLAVGYTVTSRADAGELDLAVGGLDLAIGPYLRF